MESTRDTAERAADPTLLTIMVSAVPIIEFRICSSTTGTRRLRIIRLVNICCCSIVSSPTLSIKLSFICLYFINPAIFDIIPFSGTFSNIFSVFFCKTIQTLSPMLYCNRNQQKHIPVCFCCQNSEKDILYAENYYIYHFPGGFRNFDFILSPEQRFFQTYPDYHETRRSCHSS